ncbi:MAG: sugar phosphate isomerase/epimerase [Rhizobiales bacterium]|nr:sugar phosphate isomerase/epimerase [Hyphomicrobiales bacterium]
MQPPFGRLALHTWTLETTPLEEALDAAREGGFDALELRRTDFKTCFDRGMSNDDVLALVRNAGLPVACLGVEYGWIFAEGEERTRLFDVFRQSCANAVALDCKMIMSAPGQNTGSMSQAIASLSEAADIVAEFGIRCAIEFNSQHPLINSIASLTELLDGVNRPEMGMLLDAYHLTRSGSPGRGFEEVPGEAIYAFQYSDVPPTPVGEVKRPTDRLLPGEGIVDWDGMLGLLAEKGYRGHLSFEAPNPETWARPPREVAADAVARSKAILARVTGAQ